MRVEPAPTPEEAAAIAAALEALREREPEELPLRSRWKLAGLLGHSVPNATELEGSLWCYRSRRGME